VRQGGVGLHYSSNPVDIRIRKRINPDIRVGIPDQTLACVLVVILSCIAMYLF